MKREVSGKLQEVQKMFKAWFSIGTETAVWKRWWNPDLRHTGISWEGWGDGCNGRQQQSRCKYSFLAWAQSSQQRFISDVLKSWLSQMLHINVALANGHAELVSLLPCSTVQDLRRKAQLAFGKKYLRLIAAKKLVLVDPEKTLEEAEVEDGAELPHRNYLVEHPLDCLADKKCF